MENIIYNNTVDNLRFTYRKFFPCLPHSFDLSLLWLTNDLDPMIHKLYDSGSFERLFKYKVSVPSDDPPQLERGYAGGSTYSCTTIHELPTSQYKACLGILHSETQADDDLLNFATLQKFINVSHESHRISLIPLIIYLSWNVITRTVRKTMTWRPSFPVKNLVASFSFNNR